MADRWATFDCYGTLVDWNGGVRATLERLWPDRDGAELLERYHEIEPRVQLERALPYRQVMREALRLVADHEGLPLDPADEDALGRALPSWTAFPEVRASLEDVRARGWRIAILSNTDPDLLDASLAQVGVPVELRITAAEAGSYKPAHGHWERFRAQTGADPRRHVHVAASLFHDIAPAAELGIAAVWINRLAETSELPREAELRDLTALGPTLDAVRPA
ncbi:MAG: HAD-IA family hydrolase [Actinobacteria bacterium]|nr:HAD-IA family hydrolase [Actinomycetota bacterium]